MSENIDVIIISKLQVQRQTELLNSVKVYDIKKIFWDSDKNIWKKSFSKNALHWNEEAYNILKRPPQSRQSVSD